MWSSAFVSSAIPRQKYSGRSVSIFKDESVAGALRIFMMLWKTVSTGYKMSKGLKHLER